MKGRRFILLIEIIIVVALSIFTSILALWKVALNVGYIYQRDSSPAFYLSSYQYALTFLGFPAIMDNVYIPIVVLLYFNVISPMLADWVSYFIFPFALSVPSMYFASRYFLRDTKNWVRITVSSIVAFLYAISPTSYYYSHWSNYAAFYALLPALIAGTFYALNKGGLIGSFILSLFASLTTTDPRGFVFTFFIIITILIYRHKLKDMRTFLLSIPFYFLINFRLFLILYYNFHSYSSISFSISNQQLWLNYLTFNLLDSLRGLSLFRPLVSYLAIGNSIVIYILSFSFVITGILGYIFLKKREGEASYFIILYIFLVLIISSDVDLLSYKIALNLVYPILNFLSQTPIYNYLWLFLPTYITEMILAPLFLLVSLVLAKILSNHYLIPLFFLIIVSQFAFSSSMIFSGNYLGQYNPVQPPAPILELGEFLKTHTVGNILVSAVVPSNWVEFISTLPNITTAPLLNTSSIGVILNDYGVEYVVTTVNDNITLSIINSHKNVFSLVFNNSYFLVYKNNDFTYNIISPVYVNFDYPSFPVSNGTEKVNIIPSYLMFEIPPKYLGGYIGNATYAELLVLSAYKQGVTPVSLNVKHLPFPTNFTNTINVNVYDEEILSSFPRISFISVSNSSSINLDVRPGLYKVVIIYISVPGGGVFSVNNGTYSLSVSTSSPNISIVFSCLGDMYISHEASLIFNGNSLSYLLGLMFIPYNISLLKNMSNIIAYNTSSYPYYSSPTGRALGNANSDFSIYSLSIIINLITLCFSILIFIVYIVWRTHFRKINLKIMFHVFNHGKGKR
ncbi:hypothetical protein V6M85_05690 [Sulfolobus tengchongensis]|uniref:Multipass membrane protein n=1 Tax=Sulfolobus tengchongensis TaxID=207809 RepID=A0AAX4L524_9CREN